MSYVVLARKYRPASFDDLVGQEHVARTLANAIAQGRVAHAFLFTGVRGVGKTTSARILAKALNCMRPTGSIAKGTDPGPTATPCQTCPACLEITLGTDMDVQEIDGASYNGVDEVRRLQDSLPYRPSRDRFKIFIVDEVHMLSQNAWNAFLKTLEEPPPHVKFIFATTEVRKVPITILSRVQRFDFKMIPTRLIAERLRWVLGQEGLSADEQALSIIAREAAGSMRDAMSLLDQVIAWGGDQLVGSSVAEVLGVASHQVLHELSRSLLGRDAARCLNIVGELATQGFDLAHVSRDLLGLLRDLVVAKVHEQPEALLDLSDEERKDVKELASAHDLDELIRLHQAFSRSYDEVAQSGHPRSALEMLLVRLAHRPKVAPVEELLARLGQLERRLSSRAAPPQARRPLGAEAAPPPSTQARSREARSPAPSSQAPTPPREEPPPSEARPESLEAHPGPRPHVGLLAHADNQALFRRFLDAIALQRPELAARLSHAVPLELGPAAVTLAWEPQSPFAEEAMKAEHQPLFELAAQESFGAPIPVHFRALHAGAAQATTLYQLELEAQAERRRQAVARARRHPSVTLAEEVLGAKLKELKLADPDSFRP